MENQDHPPKIVFLDFFKDIKDKISEVLNAPTIISLCDPIVDLTLVFTDINDSKQVKKFISETILVKKEKDELTQFFDNPLQTSFSYGYEEKEFVFIRLEENSPLLKSSHRNGLSGLILHEILHSVQRQRGLEVRLRNSLVFSLEFFTELASIMPSENFKQEDMIIFLKQISQVALYALKDIFVNVEMLKRGWSDQLLDFYGIELHLTEPDLISPPILEIPFKKGEIMIKDLDIFAKAFNYTISLIPVWLPTMILEEDSIFYPPSRILKQFIFSKFYINPSLITREMWHIENIFLTSFSFSKSFHLKWFGLVFNLALEYLLGEDFVFYHLSKAAELVEIIYEDQNDPERRKLAMTPILKAAYVHKKEYPAGIQQRNIDDLEASIKQYAIDDDEILELEESLNEIIQSEDEHFGHFFENLLKMSIMILSRDFRRNIILGNTKKIKRFSRVILTLLQAINYLGDQCDEKYYHSVRLTVKKIIRSKEVFKRRKLVLHLEIITKQAIYVSDSEPSPSEVEELLFNFDFFDIPFTNAFIDLGVSFIHNIRTVMQKISTDDPEFPLLVSQFILVLMANKELSEEEMDQINMILVSSLVATTGVPFTTIQPVLSSFITNVKPELNQGEE
ncbi:MAG: hypothetical protein ACXAC8_02165 [Candidatus Hodarchaeales archaeon]|jgi:hypothetical protein